MTLSPNHNALRGDRQGLMVHYSAGSFAGTVAWCRDPASGVSYNRVVGPEGEVVVLVPDDRRAWHAGVCRPTSRFAYADANSAFEGIALSGGPPVPPTAAQVGALVRVLAERMRARRWGAAEIWRITGHEHEAWPRGRKHDPSGGSVPPWLDLDAVRTIVAAALAAPSR